MKINWKLRFKNKATLTTLIVLTVGFVYQALGLFGIVPSVSENDIVNVLLMLVDIVATLGVFVDPTTSGVSDSERALAYEEPVK